MIPIETLDEDAFAPYGRVLGLARESGDAGTFLSPASDFWHEHMIDAQDGEREVLWVEYRSGEPFVSRLETHLRTEQAVIPLTGPIIQIVATSDENGVHQPASVRAFLVPQGLGICMYPGCWHATRIVAASVTCLMLTRRSTTLDLAAHLNHGTELFESRLVDVALHLDKQIV